MDNWVSTLIRCPICKAKDISFRDSIPCTVCLGSGWLCGSCGSHFPIRDGEPYFLPFVCSRSPSPQIAAWDKAQQQFVGWQSDYSLATAKRDERAYNEIHAQFELPGRVLDVGGGAGMARKFLVKGQDYVSVEPDLSWRAKLALFSQIYPDVMEPFAQVGALAEYLPLAPAAFNSVLMSNVIDHCFDVHLALAEAHRVLIPGGTLVVGLSLGGIWAKLQTLASEGPFYASRYLGSKGLSYLRRGLTRYGTGHIFNIHDDDIPALLHEHDLEVTDQIGSRLMPRVRFFVARRPSEPRGRSQVLNSSFMPDLE